MKSSGEQNFESATMPHVHALFQTAFQLTEDRAAAAELVTEVYSHAGKSFARHHRPADWRSVLFKILIERARRRSDRTTEGGRAVLVRMRKRPFLTERRQSALRLQFIDPTYWCCSATLDSRYWQ